jgi:hypothetical protein
LGEENSRHPPATQLALNGIGAGERLPQRIQQIRQDAPGKSL